MDSGNSKQSTKATENATAASGWQPRQEGPDRYPGSGRGVTSTPKLEACPLREAAKEGASEWT
jgi:hypothetical protein